MGVEYGLSVDGINYFSDLLEDTTSDSPSKPDWMEFGKQIGKLTGHYEILDFMSGITGMQKFLMRPKWPIGGMYFDGIMRTEHTSRVRPTTYPVQTGVTMTDHAIIEPAELTIEVMMTDSPVGPAFSGGLAVAVGETTGGILGSIFSGIGLADIALSNMGLQGIYPSNFGDLPCTPSMTLPGGEGRSVAAWKNLRSLLISRVPITVETRLGTYNNMLIEELSAPDDVKTLHALRCTIRMREVLSSEVAETQTSVRKSATAEASASGQVPGDTGEGVQKTAAQKIKEAAGL